MGYRVTQTDASVDLDENALLWAFAAELKARSITTDAQFSAAINGMTSAQFEAFIRALIKKWIKVG